MKTQIGIDIGLKGGFAIALEGVLMETMVMPITKDGDVDIDSIKQILEGTMGERFVIFEYITPLHKASKKTNWLLARQCGAIEALCIALNIPFIRIPPKSWQKDMFHDIPPIRKKDGTADTKKMAELAVRKIHPTMNFKTNMKANAKNHDGIIDAVLIVEFWKRKNKLYELFKL